MIITNAQGEEVTRILYKPYGEIDQGHSVGLDSTTYKFTSQELDEETNLYYYGARFYDPQLGRFLTADTIVPDPYNPQDYNRYAYVRNNPIMYTDPTGHWAWLVGAAIGAFAAHQSSGGDAQATIMGGIIGGISGGVGGYAGSFYSGATSGIVGGAAGGATGGALGNAYYGGNILQGAAIGAISGGVGGGVGASFANDGILASRMMGGLSGGATGGALNAAYYGGNIGQSALGGGLAGLAGGMVSTGLQYMYDVAAGNPLTRTVRYSSSAGLSSERVYSRYTGSVLDSYSTAMAICGHSCNLIEMNGRVYAPHQIDAFGPEGTGPILSTPIRVRTPSNLGTVLAVGSTTAAGIAAAPVHPYIRVGATFVGFAFDGASAVRAFNAGRYVEGGSQMAPSIFGVTRSRLGFGLSFTNLLRNEIGHSF